MCHAVICGGCGHVTLVRVILKQTLDKDGKITTEETIVPVNEVEARAWLETHPEVVKKAIEIGE
jgi:hypothetical protein